MVEGKFEYTVKEAAESIAPIFQQEGWHWASTQGMYIPTTKEIEENIRNAIQSLLEDKNAYLSSSGRIMVTRDEFGEFSVGVMFGLRN